MNKGGIGINKTNHDEGKKGANEIRIKKVSSFLKPAPTSTKNLDITEELRIRAFCDLGGTDFYP